MKLLTRSCLALLGSLGMVGSAYADIVHNDDVIITFSQCVGNDCVNGENFGADTVRLKENNLRIHFNDTSNSASFPTNDWRIVANDSTNGGANYLAFEDSSANRIPFRVEAGAPANALVVEADGDIGVKTLNPVVDIHIVEGNTPTVRLEQDGSDGFTPQTWDLAGNEANFFIRDVTNGSQLPLRIEPGADTNSLFVDSDGNVGMGTNNPAAGLHVDNDEMNALLVSGNGVKLADLRSDDSGIIQYRLLTDSSDRRIVGLNQAGTVVESQIQMGDEQVVIAGSAIGAPFATFTSAGLVTTGAGACNPGPCDGVFDPAQYKVESIDEHARYMWENKYLWGVGPTPEGEPMNLTRKTAGILHELEKAHIYIEQLHNRLNELEARLVEK